MHSLTMNRYKSVVDDIGAMNWAALSAQDLVDCAWAYYYFSIQFRESLEVACHLHPTDENLAQLRREECGTANLSPWPGVAEPGERMNHDEFMRRTILLSPIDPERRARLERLGQAYLASVRGADDRTKALAIASYEDGGLEQVFTAFLTAAPWDGPVLGAFKHFLTEHIRFDSDPDQGHGALSRHLAPDDRVLPLWSAFHDLLAHAVPKLAQ